MSYKALLNKKVFVDLQTKIFKDEIEYIVEKREQPLIIQEIKKYILSENEKLSYYLKFDIMDDYIGKKADKYSYSSYYERYSKKIIKYISLTSEERSKYKIWLTIKSSSHTKQSFAFYAYFDEQSKLKADIILYNNDRLSDREEEPFEMCIENIFSYSADKDRIVKFIDSIIETHKELAKQEELKKIKKNKVNNLKEKTVEAKVQEIMKEKKLPYRIESSKTRMVLIIKFEKSKIVEIKILFSKFHLILQKLGELIDKLIEINNQEIEITYKQTNDNRQSWIYPEEE